MKRGVIFGAMPVSEKMASWWHRADVVIAADAGYQTAQRLGVPVDVLLGDFDSAPMPTERPDAERLPTEKDDTDTHYAARRALELGCDEVVILGGLGGRLDHTLANMQTLVFLEKQGVHAVLADETTQVNVLLHGTLTVYRPEGACYCSVFPIGERAEEVTLEGLKYPLHDAVLTNVWPVGVSNEFLQDRAHISVRNGGLYILVCSKQQSGQST